MRLHNYWRSSASWRVRIALALKGVECEYVAVNIVKDGGAQHTAAYRAMNPLSQVPTLELSTPSGPRFIAQSLAIIEYLDETVPQPALLPRDPYLRARARQLAEMVNAGVQPLQNLEPQRYVREVLHADPAAWTRHFIERGMAALEESARETAGRFLVGDEVTVADVCLVPQMLAARRFAGDVAAYPTLLRVEAECLRLDAFSRTRPELMPDAVSAT